MLKFIIRNFRWIAGGFLLTYFSSFGQTYFISASASEWQAVFDLSHGEFGRLYMYATVASALCLPFVGRVVDVMKVHRVIVLVVPVFAGAALLAGTAPTLPLLVFAIFLLRLCGCGMMDHISLTATARWFVTERGRAVSLVSLGHPGGEATLPLVFAALTITYGYSASWTVAAASLLIIGFPVAYWCYRQPRVPHGQLSPETNALPEVRNWTRREVLRDPIFWVLLTCVLGPVFISTTIFFYQNYLTTLNGWPPHLFATSLAVLAFTSIGFALLTGAAVDRYGAVSVLRFFLLPSGAACFALAYSGSEIMLFVVMTLLGISTGIGSTLFGVLWPEIYGVANLGAIRSIAEAVGVFATAAGPGLTGTLIDLGISLPTQMIFYGGYCILGTAAMMIVSTQLQRRKQITSDA
jgi:MFS family permease